MLFLAVFAGFLAENIRESRGDEKKVSAYMASYCRDLESDTLNFNHALRSVKNKISAYDSVVKFLNSPNEFNNLLPFNFYIKTNIDVTFVPIEPTYQQLKNSGNLRLIKNNLVLDSIQNYEGTISGDYQEQVNYDILFNRRLVQMQEKLFDYTNLNRYLNDRYTSSVDADHSKYSLFLISHNRDNVQELSNLFIGSKAADIFYISSLEDIRDNAVNLLAFIKTEYKL